MGEGGRGGRTVFWASSFQTAGAFTQGVCKGKGEREEDFRISLSFCFVSHHLQVLVGFYVVMYIIY